MANLVLKSNTANKTFQVQQKVFKFPFVKNKIELIITPQKLYSINSKDFSTGVLPSLVSKVEFENLGDKIIASVFIKQEIVSSKNMILDIPITGKGFLKVDRFNIVETVKTSGEVLIDNFSPHPKSVVDGQTKYIIKNDLGKKSLVFSKTFTVTEDFKFTKSPTYTISGNSNRYSVTTKVKKDKNKNVFSKTFDFYYTSPDAVTVSKDTEISFSVSTNYSSEQIYAEGITKVNKNKIYSIDKGKDLGPQGGSKRMIVKGAPGSTFSFLVSNSTGQMYDKNSGAFSDSGSVITGVIPKAANGKSFGESIIRINVPRSAAAQTISTQFFKQEEVEVQKAKLEKATTTVEIDKIQGEGKIKETKTLSLTTPTLTFKVTTTGYLGPKVKIISSGVTTTSTNIFLGKEGREELKIIKPGVHRFRFSVSASAANKVVQITRQPLFEMPAYPEDNYVAWDSDETKKRIAQQADGTAIPSDWDWSSIERDTNVDMKISCAGLGKILSTDAISGISHYSYAQVQVTGEIRVGSVGEASSNLSLNLNNFLSVITPS